MKEIKIEDIKEMSENELHKTLYEYYKPVIDDCSQGSRLKYIREYRQMTTNEVAELCPHLTGEYKVRLIQKYEKNDRSPKPYILEDLAKVYNVSINATNWLFPRGIERDSLLVKIRTYLNELKLK